MSKNNSVFSLIVFNVVLNISFALSVSAQTMGEMGESPSDTVAPSTTEDVVKESEGTCSITVFSANWCVPCKEAKKKLGLQYDDYGTFHVPSNSCFNVTFIDRDQYEIDNPGAPLPPTVPCMPQVDPATGLPLTIEVNGVKQLVCSVPDYNDLMKNCKCGYCNDATKTCDMQSVSSNPSGSHCIGDSQCKKKDGVCTCSESYDGSVYCKSFQQEVWDSCLSKLTPQTNTMSSMLGTSEDISDSTKRFCEDQVQLELMNIGLGGACDTSSQEEGQCPEFNEACVASPSPSPSASASASRSPTNTPSASASASASRSPSNTPSASASASASRSPSNTPSASASASASRSPSNTPSGMPTVTDTDTPSESPSDSLNTYNCQCCTDESCTAITVTANSIEEAEGQSCGMGGEVKHCSLAS